MLKVVCASANPHKFEEIIGIMSGVVELLPRPVEIAEVEETADSLVGNARLKAQSVCEATGMPALADDTGLEVDALGGAPGVRSARYARPESNDAANRHKLLAQLDGIAADQRTARFRTIALMSWPDGRELMAEGVCEGRIADRERGDRGFGYDSLFIATESDGRTFAEMSLEEKQHLSHRVKAFQALTELLLPTS